MKQIYFSSIMTRAALFLVVFVAVARLTHVSCNPVPVSPDAVKFLERFGYLNRTDDSNESVSLNSLSDSVKKYQELNQLPVTGLMDEATMTMMSKPRCGQKDVKRGDNESGFKWDKRKILYMFQSFPSSMSRNDARWIIREAYNAWSRVIPIDFEERSQGPVDVVINFWKGSHSGWDSYGRRLTHDAFHKEDNVAAHGWYPVVGDLCFNDKKNWAYNQRNGLGLMQVALHEIGHSIGLDHLHDRNSIMFPSTDNRQDPRLSDNDINAARAMYGGR